ncbi:amino acid ABC transporter membrane protein 1, PAAT family [Bartonella apihabitans]|uniref:Amino acid ABC transporter membrane protein 1, PAAT family n=2 Tax=Bartonella apihabitans TaxID=2750929 RepID=A0A1U9M8U1_9HYPH|nr:amino acid ABC transporter membrane protein 1, PAAT family [Bartonella apihabitans]
METKVKAMFNYKFQWGTVWQHINQLLAGAWVSLYTTAICMVLSILIGLVLLVMRRSTNRPLAAIAITWISIARNTPALLQLYFLYFGFGAFGIFISSWWALLIGITFNSAGYLAENFRGGLQAVPETQTCAARSLGMTAFQSFHLVVVPQLLRVVYYPLTNQLIWALLMTSLGVVVGLDKDLMAVTKTLADSSYRTFEYFFAAAVIYYIMSKMLLILARLSAWKILRY